MFKKRRAYFFIFPAVILFFSAESLAGDLPSAAGERASLELESIFVTSEKPYLLNAYSIEPAPLKNYFDSPVEALTLLPADLQSRSLKGGIQTDFSLRGSTFQGVTVLVDGQRVNDPQTAHHNCDIPLTTEDIKKIDLIPGAGSSVFGPDAIGGAVNFITKKPGEKKRAVNLSLGSFETGAARFSVSDTIRDLGFRLSCEREESGGFRYDTDFKKFTTSLASSMPLPDGEYNFNLGYQEKEFGAYDFYTPNMGYPSKEWTKTYLLNTGLNLDEFGLTVKPNFLWRRHYDKFVLDKTEARSRYRNDHKTDVITPNIYLQKESDLLGNTGFGVEYGQERIDSTSLGRHNRTHKSVYLDENKDLFSKLSLGLSGRVDDFDGFDTSYTGSASAKFILEEGQTVTLAVSRSMRAPSFTELYYDDPTTIGDPNLSAEKSVNYQAGYDYKKSIFSGGLTFFIRQEDDIIDWVKRASSQKKWTAENISEAQVEGIEHYFGMDINRNIAFNTSYAYIDKRINDKGYLYKYGPNYARHLVNANLVFNLPFGVQTISAAYKKRPARDGWFLLNSRLSCDVNKNSQLFLVITNLLNVGYQDIEGIPQPGRYIEGGARFEW